MITCHNCGSERTGCVFNFASGVYEAECQDCGYTGPVTHEDAATFQQQQADVMRNLMQVCEGKPWSSFQKRGNDANGGQVP